MSCINPEFVKKVEADLQKIATDWFIKDLEGSRKYWDFIMGRNPDYIKDWKWPDPPFEVVK
jgi:hypothetical protein